MSKRPRVLYLCGWPIGAHGEGAVSFVYEQIEVLSKQVDAAFVEFEFCSIGESLWRRVRRRRAEHISELWPVRVRALRIWTPRLSTRLSRRTLLEDIDCASASVLRQVNRELGQIDLIHSHVVLPAGLLGAGMSRISGVPMVLQEHSGPFEMHLETEEKRHAVQSVLNQSRSIIAVGPSLKKQISGLVADPAKVVLIPNLVRTKLFSVRPQLRDSRVMRLVTVASLDPIKGLDVLLDAINLIRHGGRDVRLTIVGEGPLRDHLAGRIDEADLHGHVLLMGGLPREGVAEQLARADIYVCSSHAETFGLAPAEALSVGRPVVTTRCGGPEMYVDDSCGVVVPVADAVALAAGIRDVWSRRNEFEPIELHERMERQFGEKIFTERICRLYDGLVNSQCKSYTGSSLSPGVYS